MKDQLIRIKEKLFFFRMTDSDLGDGHCLSPLSMCVGAWVRVCMGAWVRERVGVCERTVGKGGIEDFGRVTMKFT